MGMGLLKRNLVAAAFAVSSAAGQEAGHSYYRHPETNLVLDFWSSAKNKISMKVHSVDPQNSNMRKLAAKGLEKAEASESDVLKFCGFGSERGLQFLNMKEAGSGHYKGEMKVGLDILRGKGDVYGSAKGVSIHLKGESALLRGWYQLPSVASFLNGVTQRVTYDMKLNRVENPGRGACLAPGR